MKGHGEKISRKQEQAIINMLIFPTIGEAAKQTGISEVTLWRWLQLSDFADKYRAAKRQAVSQAIARLQQTTTLAVDTLVEVMQSIDAKDTAKVTAAKVILEMAFKAVEVEDLAAKVEELEQLIQERLEGQRNC